MVVQCLKLCSLLWDEEVKNRERFEPFVEEGVPFDEYCQNMEKDGTWAGNIELQAASLVTHSNICIHRHSYPRWYIRNFDNRQARMIHLSYHDGEHYNSVRSKDDSCTGPARPIVIKVDADLSATPRQGKNAMMKSKVEAAGDGVEPGCLKMVMDGTGCEDVERVKQSIEEVGGDVDAAIEYLLALKGSEEDASPPNELPSSENLTFDENHKEENKQQKTKTKNKTQNTQESHTENSLPCDNKIIPRNKACPCGSRKKYKSCCGSVVGRSSARLAINQTTIDGNDRNDKRQRKKSQQNVLNHGSAGGQPDLGALCI